MRLDQKFWSGFAEKYWEKKSVHIENVDSPLLKIDADEIFELLVRYANLCRRSKDAKGFKFYAEGARVPEMQVLQLLPIAKDRDLKGYHRRMEAYFPDYCLVCDELLQVNHDQQDKLIEFTSGLYEAVGFPNRFSEMGLYLGNYRKTPFGVHVDGCGVFSFPVVGKKKFRIWSSDYVRRNPKLDRAFTYAPFKKDSLTLTAHPGDMTYWPSSAWHIAESDGSFSATWSLGVWIDQPVAKDVADVIAQLISQSLGAKSQDGVVQFHELAKPNGEVSRLPAVYENAIAKIQNLSASELRRVFLNQWAKHISKQGFKTSPSAPKVLKTGSSLKLRSIRSPILWSHDRAAKKLRLSFQGHVVDAPDSKALIGAISALNSGTSLKVTPKLLAALRLFAEVGAFK